MDVLSIWTVIQNALHSKFTGTGVLDMLYKAMPI